MQLLQNLYEASSGPVFGRNVHRRSLPLVVLLAATVMLSIVLPANAAPAFLKNRTLVNTYFATNTGVKAACGPALCTAAPVPLFAPAPLPIECPGKVGATCTFYIHLETDDSVTKQDRGFFQFLVGGVPPVPGPLLGGGFFIWDNADPNSAVAMPFSHSYAVTAFVTNNALNQVWPVLVSLSCLDTGLAPPVGCTATNFLANLEVQVYTP
jgi:hypothetical protein